MSNTPNLRLPYLDANQNQKSVTHNAALRMLDALVSTNVQSTALQAPPAAPADGQCWIVASGGTGAWAGKDLNLAAWQDGAWAFYAPNPGTVAYVDALDGALVWNGTAWMSLLGAIASLALQTLGVGTAADPSNPLSAQLNAALFSALPTTASPAGSGDVRVKLSKQGSANTASILFQDAASGRAEVGLAGDDNLHLRVSPDGSTFVDALVVASAGGAVSFTASPSAPTPAAGDATAKLATTAFVAAALAALVAAAPGALDTLKELADALGDDPNFSATVTNALAAKAPLASPALTGTPTAPNAAPGTNSAQLATTSFVAASFVTYAYAGQTYATAANATLTGTPTAPTPAFGDNGGKIATTAYVDRAIARTQVNDAAYAVLPTDRTVAVVALSAARTLTLPAAKAYPQGVTLTILDESGACSGTNIVTIAVPAPPSGSPADTISGLSAVPLATPYGYVALQCNGYNKWTLVDTPLVLNHRTFVDVYGAQNQVIGNSFTRIQMASVNADTGGNWDTTNFWYTCPRSGIYSIAATLRVVDGTAQNSQYGLGVYTNEQDGQYFLWHAVIFNRSTYPYARLSYQNRGDQLRMFSYSDAGGNGSGGSNTLPSGTTTGVKLAVAGLQILLVSDA